MNTKLFGLFIALLVCLPSLAQQKPVEKVDSDGVYLMPDQMPEFPGGMQAMMKFLTTNIKYPVGDLLLAFALQMLSMQVWQLHNFFPGKVLSLLYKG